jgi:hypothetical protein
LITPAFYLIKNDMGCAQVIFETRMETAGIQTGMALTEQEGKGTDIDKDLMQVRRPRYKSRLDVPSRISLILARTDLRASIDAFTSSIKTLSSCKVEG